MPSAANFSVDFDTFVDIIDMIGGVDIHNDETLFIDPVYHGKEFPKVKLTCCGMRHLTGRVALAVAPLGEVMVTLVLLLKVRLQVPLGVVLPTEAIVPTGPLSGFAL